jgi:hypothetical protein
VALSAVERLAEREAARDEHKAELAEKRAEQKILDLDAIEALEQERGDSNVATEEIPFTPGLPVLVAARCPTEIEIKRYQSRLKKGRDGEEPDPIAAGQEVGAVCRIYPDDETWAKVLKARPGVVVALGVAALRLAGAVRREAGKG